MSTKSAIRRIEKTVGHTPSLFFVSKRHSRIPCRGFRYAKDPKIDYTYYTVCELMAFAAEKGVIPAVSYDDRYKGEEKDRLRLGNVRDQVIKGKHDIAITEVAQIFKRFGDEYGGFFIRTMREMNMPGVFPWTGNAKKFKQAWTHIWNIFDGEGANEYATWVWNPYVGQYKWRKTAHFYYPGDKYVDWIGFNGYNWDQLSRQSKRHSTRTSFSSLFSDAYKQYLSKNKPMMISEVGMDNLPYKPSWILDAFDKTKSEMPGIKGLTWYHKLWSSGGIHDFNSRIDSSRKSLEAFKKGISDPYFLGKVPYNNL